MIELIKKQEEILNEARDMIIRDVTGEGCAKEDKGSTFFGQTDRMLLWMSYIEYIRLRDNDFPWENDMIDPIISVIDRSLSGYRDSVGSMLYQEGVITSPGEFLAYTLFGKTWKK